MDPIGRALEKTQRPTPIHTPWSKTTEIAGHGTSTPMLGEMYLLLLVNHILEHSFFDRYHTLPAGRPSVASTALHPGHVTVNDSDFQSLPPGQAWVVFPKDSVHSSNNFTARPLNLASSIGSRLKQSFSNINRGTPPQSVTPVQAFFNTSDQAQLVGYT